MVLSELCWNALDAGGEYRRHVGIDPAHPQHRLCDERDFSGTTEGVRSVATREARLSRSSIYSSQERAFDRPSFCHLLWWSQMTGQSSITHLYEWQVCETQLPELKTLIASRKT